MLVVNSISSAFIEHVNLRQRTECPGDSFQLFNILKQNRERLQAAEVVQGEGVGRDRKPLVLIYTCALTSDEFKM